MKYLILWVIFRHTQIEQCSKPLLLDDSDDIPIIFPWILVIYNLSSLRSEASHLPEKFWSKSPGWGSEADGKAFSRPYQLWIGGR